MRPPGMPTISEDAQVTLEADKVCKAPTRPIGLVVIGACTGFFERLPQPLEIRS